MMNILVLFLSAWTFANTPFDLSGKWFNSSNREMRKPIEFIKIKDTYHFHSQEKFVDQEGRILYTIDQTVKVANTPGPVLTGTVDFFDSRGCTFKALSVVVEFQHPEVVNVLMTVPRYRHVGCSILEYVEIPVQLIRY